MVHSIVFVYTHTNKNMTTCGVMRCTNPGVHPCGGSCGKTIYTERESLQEMDDGSLQYTGVFAEVEGWEPYLFCDDCFEKMTPCGRCVSGDKRLCQGCVYDDDRHDRCQTCRCVMCPADYGESRFICPRCCKKKKHKITTIKHTAKAEDVS